MEKPKKPIEPKWEDYPTPKEPNAKNHLGQPLYQKLDWVRDIEKYQKDMKQYEKDMEVYTQLKFIRLIKNSSEKYVLKTFTIIKNK